jgi:hypothetical protein
MFEIEEVARGGEQIRVCIEGMESELGGRVGVIERLQYVRKKKKKKVCIFKITRIKFVDMTNH